MIGRGLKQAAEDRAEAKRQRERQEGFEDWERGLLPDGSEPPPRERETYPGTQVPADFLPALERERAGGPTVADFLRETPDEGFQPRPGIGPDLEDAGFQRPAPSPREAARQRVIESLPTRPEAVAPSIADFLGEEPLQNLQPRRFPGMDPYTVGGKRYDPEVPLQRGLSTRRAELTLADELDEASAVRGAGRTRAEAERERQRAVADLVAAGVDPARAAAIAGNAGLMERELYPDQFRSTWPTGGDGERKPIPSMDAAINAIYKLYGTYDPNLQTFVLPPQVTPDWLYGAAQALQVGQDIPDLPAAPELPPEEGERPAGLWKRLGQALIPGGKSGFWDQPAGGIEGPTPEDDEESQGAGISVAPQRRVAPRDTVEQGAPVRAGKIPVTPEEYAAIVEDEGPAFAAKHYRTRHPPRVR
jgi:hypothetical protein